MQKSEGRDEIYEWRAASHLNTFILQLNQTMNNTRKHPISSGQVPSATSPVNFRRSTPKIHLSARKLAARLWHFRFFHRSSSHKVYTILHFTTFIFVHFHTFTNLIFRYPCPQASILSTTTCQAHRGRGHTR